MVAPVSSKGPKGLITFESNDRILIEISGEYDAPPGALLYVSGSSTEIFRAEGQRTASVARCIKDLHSRPARSFEVVLKGTVASMEASVSLTKTSATMLPLIRDMLSNCSSEAKTQAKFEPPTGIWSLIALLHFLDRKATSADIVTWMKDPTGAPTQPGEILHMANYLGVSSVVSALLNGFRDIFHSLDTEREKSRIPYGHSHREVPEDPNNEYLSRVLWNLPDVFAKDILKKESIDWKIATSKTEIAFAKWLQVQDFGSSLELRKDNKDFPFPGASEDTIKKIVRSLPNCQQITELRGEAKVVLPELQQIQCRNPNILSDRSLSLSLDIFDAKEHYADAFLDNADPLGVMGRTVVCLTLGSISLRGCLDNSYSKKNRYSSAASWTFFRAIRRLKNLKKLVLCRPHWSGALQWGHDVASPLAELPGLVVEATDGSVLARVQDNQLKVY